MKIEALRFTDEKYGEQDRSILLIDGKNSLSVGNLCECPEDATIDRDLIAADQVMEYMKKAYKLGKENIDVEFISRNITADELGELN